MLMIDPDGNIAGSFDGPHGPAPGSIAPVQHAAWGNVPATVLTSGVWDPAVLTTLSPCEPARPNAGHCAPADPCDGARRVATKDQ